MLTKRNGTGKALGASAGVSMGVSLGLRVLVLGTLLASLPSLAANTAWRDAERVVGEKNALRGAMRNPQGLLPNIPTDTDPELAERESLYANGAGKLFMPGMGEVVRCRSLTDPTCRAVQMLDRGFPEKDATVSNLPKDLNDKRDQLVKDTTERPASSSGGCSPLSVTLPESFTEEVCRPGGHEIAVNEVLGAQKTGEILATWWGCVNAHTETLSETCSAKRSVTVETPMLYDMRCVVPAPSKLTTRVLTTRASVTASFDYQCTESPAVIETITCSQKRVVTTRPACPAGEEIATTFDEKGVLEGREIPFTATHRCGDKGSVVLSTPFSPAQKMQVGRPGFWRNLTGFQKSGVRFAFKSLKCEEGSCLATVSAEFRYNQRVMQTVTGVLVFPEDDAKVEDVMWVDDCAPFEKAKKAAGGNEP